jgi:hypothetical protein
MDDMTFDDNDLGNVPDTGKETVDLGEMDPDFLAGLAANAKTAEEIAAEEAAATKTAADQAEADKLAAEKLIEEQEAERKGFVPKGRFNEINDEKKHALEKAAAVEEENRKLKEALAALEKGEIKPKEPELDPLDVLEARVVELDIIKSRALSDFGFDSQDYQDAVKAYNKLNRELMRMESQTSAGNAVAGLRGEDAALTATRSELAEVAEAAYEVYPFLNKNGDGFDADAINDVLELRNDLISVTGAKGQPKYTPAQALQKAIDKLAPGHAIRIGTVAPTTDNDKVKQIKEAREKAAREKAALATRGQAPLLGGRVAEETFKPEIEKLTPKEIGEMSEEQQAVLLGNA